MAMFPTHIKCSTLGGSNHGVITMFSGAPTTVTCTLQAPSGSTRVFSDPITIHVRYRYGEEIVQPVIIQAVGAAGSNGQ